MIWTSPLTRLSDVAYAIMRIAPALHHLVFGCQNVFGVLGGNAVPTWSLLGVAAQLELLLGSLIAIGLLTPWAAFLASGEMAFAYYIGHASRGGLPVQNGGTPAVAFCFAFLYIATRGGGRYSVDAWLRRAT